MTTVSPGTREPGVGAQEWLHNGTAHASGAWPNNRDNSSNAVLVLETSGVSLSPECELKEFDMFLPELNRNT